MKKLIILVIAFLLFSSTVHAALILKGQGTSTHGTYNLIYDDDLDITWYDFTNAGDTWDNQVAWADALSVDFGGNIFEDWRLPATVDGIADSAEDWGDDGTTTGGLNITTSEMGHLYFTELGNLAIRDTSGNERDWSIVALKNTGDFQNLEEADYWSSTEYAADTSLAWTFYPGLGYQSHDP